MKDPGAVSNIDMLVRKEDVYSWFRESSSSQRLDLICNLLHICLPFELRFDFCYYWFVFLILFLDELHNFSEYSTEDLPYRYTVPDYCVFCSYFRSSFKTRTITNTSVVS